MKRLKIIGKYFISIVVWALIWLFIFNGIDETLLKLPNWIFYHKIHGNVRSGLAAFGASIALYFIYMGYKSKKNEYWKSDLLIFYLEKKSNISEKVKQFSEEENLWWLWGHFKEVIKRVDKNGN